MMMTLMAAALAAQTPALRSGLEPLGFLVGHCWQGRFPTGEVDTHCFEPVFGGQHVRDRHEVTGGRRPYKGETIYSWDGAANVVTYTYWNTSGGVSRGTMRAEADRLQFGDESYRGADGGEISIATNWRRLSDDSYESATVSPNAPAMNRTIRFERLDPVTISETRSLDGSLMLVHEAMVEASLAEVWDAIATPEGWRGWAVPVAWETEAGILETSYDPRASPGDPSTIRHMVIASVPGRLMAFRTVKAPQGFPHFDTFARTTAMFELEPEGEAHTRVRIVNSGYPDDDAGRQLIGFFREGNRITLDRLRRRFSDGPIDWSRERSESGGTE